MTVLHCDFETRSLVNLKLRGLDNYAKDPSTKALMLSWAFDDDAVELWQPHITPDLPTEVKKALESDVQIAAWNATFERTIFLHCLGIWIPLERWADPMVWARHLSLPGSLEDCGTALGIAPDQGKQKDGRRLIHKFSIPYTMGGEHTLFGVTTPDFLDWGTDPEDWQLFGNYCVRDTEVERRLLHIMQRLPLPEIEQRAWVLDQKINSAGIPTSEHFIKNALWLAEKSKEDLDKTLKAQTGLKNPNSRDQLIEWAHGQGYPFASMRKEFVIAAIMDSTNGMSDLCRTVLKLRQESAKTSYKKYDAIQQLVSSDGRVRNQYLFMGASRTGRWSGTGFQPQNPPRPTKAVEEAYDRALELVAAGDFQKIKDEFTSVINVVTSCVRSAIQAPPGMRMDVCDLNAIENRVLGWVARCDAILKVFRDGQCPYLAFAAKMYGVSYESLHKILDGKHVAKDKDAKERRQVAKPAVLGAGYGLGPGVVKRIDFVTGKITYVAETEKDQYGNTVYKGLLKYAQDMGVKLTPEQAYFAWETFRKSYPEVVTLWYDLENAAVDVIEKGGSIEVGPVTFKRVKTKEGAVILRIVLPSGRALHYLNARIKIQTLKSRKTGEDYTKAGIFYDGVGHGVGKIGSGWGEVYTYGGKLAENIVQAISRDILLNGMLLADGMGAEIFLHAHDEMATLSDAGDPFSFSLHDLKWCMMQTPFWAPGLPLYADGYTGSVYKKG